MGGDLIPTCFSRYKNKQLNQTMEVHAIIERAADGSFSVYTKEDFKNFGIIGAGDTPEEAIADFWEAREELKKDIKDMPEMEVTFLYDVPSFLRQFREEFSMSGLEVITGINQKQLHHYLSGHSRPSATTKKKIQEGIAAFAAKLTAIQFA